jgi:hypothetical protein
VFIGKTSAVMITDAIGKAHLGHPCRACNCIEVTATSDTCPSNPGYLSSSCTAWILQVAACLITVLRHGLNTDGLADSLRLFNCRKGK